MSQEVAISVVVPVYRVERFVGRCAESLFGQTMREGVEFIFVDDATPDGSMAVVGRCLERHPERKAQVRVLRHTQNMGLPAARNTGLGAASGEYVFHCDSDDFLEQNALERMYCAARAHDADIVWCDWYLSMAGGERYMRQPCYDTPLEALKAMLCGGMKYNVWNKLARRRLYTANGIAFPAGHGMGEDMAMMRLFAVAGKVFYLNEALYHYVRTNEAAFTRLGGPAAGKHLGDLRHNVERTIEFVRQSFGGQMERELAFFQLEAKFPFLITDDRESYRLWREWFPEANRFIMQNKSVSLRSRLLQYMAARGQYWYVWLYNFLLVKVVYGMIYGNRHC